MSLGVIFLPPLLLRIHPLLVLKNACISSSIGSTKKNQVKVFSCRRLDIFGYIENSIWNNSWVPNFKIHLQQYPKSNYSILLWITSKTGQNLWWRIIFKLKYYSWNVHLLAPSLTLARTHPFLPPKKFIFSKKISVNEMNMSENPKHNFSGVEVDLNVFEGTSKFKNNVIHMQCKRKN